MTKIAVISAMLGYSWGGSEYLWAAMASQALASGHEVFISVYESISHPLITQIQEQGAQLLPLRKFPKVPSLAARITRRLKRNLPFLQESQPESSYQPVFDCKPDVICISQGGSYDAAVYAPDFLRLLHSAEIPYTIVCQFNADTYSLDSAAQTLAKQFFALAARVAFVSRHNLKLAERQVAQSLPNAVVVQNPVNLSDISAIAWSERAMKSFASVARLEVAFKGQDVLLEALSLPIWQERDWQCRLYGAGPDRAYLEELARHYGIADRVKFMGYVNDVRSIWSENHLLILPSRAEGTPLALVEAMLCGRPAVVTDVGGNAEWIEEPMTGFIAEAPTARSLSAALERAWLASANWNPMGVTAHEYATARLDNSPGKSLLDIVLAATKS